MKKSYVLIGGIAVGGALALTIIKYVSSFKAQNQSVQVKAQQDVTDRAELMNQLEKLSIRIDQLNK